VVCGGRGVFVFGVECDLSSEQREVDGTDETCACRKACDGMRAEYHSGVVVTIANI
jgi:hypothetical protein